MKACWVLCLNLKNLMKAGDQGSLRNQGEQQAAAMFVEVFEQTALSPLQKLSEFARFVRHQDITRLLARYEIFKRVLHVKGSIIECGVLHGSGLMSWANFSAILEPTNLTRRIYGFDTFEGFAGVDAKDASPSRRSNVGDLKGSTKEELEKIIHAYDLNRPLGHVSKVSLIKGNAVDTIPEFIRANQHLVVSLLFLDFDLFEPTKSALQHFVPRMPKGSILAFDELDNPSWPGETLALLESLGIGSVRLERLPFDPYISFTVL